MNFTFEELVVKVFKWANDVGISTSRPQKQWQKMREEVYELANAIHDNDIDSVADELGDVLVTCIVQAQLWNLDPVECLEGAYNKIHARKSKGELVDGVFVKEADLKMSPT